MIQFDEYKAWSMLSPKPVLFGDNMCYWYGFFMHKNMAMTIACNRFMHMPVTPRQKKQLWNLTYDMINTEARNHGHNVDFDLAAYAPDRLFSYLAECIQEKIYHEKLLADWDRQPTLIIEHFLITQ